MTQEVVSKWFSNFKSHSVNLLAIISAREIIFLSSSATTGIKKGDGLSSCKRGRGYGIHLGKSVETLATSVIELEAASTVAKGWTLFRQETVARSSLISLQQGFFLCIGRMAQSKAEVDESTRTQTCKNNPSSNDPIGDCLMRITLSCIDAFRTKKRKILDDKGEWGRYADYPSIRERAFWGEYLFFSCGPE